MSSTTTKPLPGYDEALAMVLRYAPALGDEAVTLGEARGRVLRGAVVADRDQPPFHRAAMDGFAIRSGEFARGHLYGVTGEVAAGQRGWEDLSNRAGVIRIATGAPVPDTFDAVIPIEQANVSEDHETEQVTFDVDEVSPWRNIHRRAADAKAGATILEAGTRLGPHHLGIAAAAGAAALTVAQQPRITLLTSGDEVRPFDTPAAALESQQIRNSNAPVLAAMLEALGAPLLHHEHVPDEPERTLAAAREALSRSHIVVTVGGVSAGQRDLLPWAWKKLGLGAVLHGVAIQPGRPLLVCSDAYGVLHLESDPQAGRERSERTDSPPQSRVSNTGGQESRITPSKLVLGLPGNPVSVLATAHLFLWPVLMRMLVGADGPGAPLPWREVKLAGATQPNPHRELFRAATLNADGAAAAIHWHGSGDLMHTAAADGFIRLPTQPDTLDAGDAVPFLPLIV